MSVKDPLVESVKPKTNWYIVLRPFDGNGVKFIRGEVVDTTGWRHTAMLEQRRYIAPVPHGMEIPEWVEVENQKRRMIQAPAESTEKKGRKKN
ncbi:MAG: hypothetical protein EBU84_05500 [Actinobacteria bacterium]|nr:hypothetical protein [Actinomycetota bacterium]